MSQRLIVCVPGGTAPRAETELHDVAFAIGDSLEAVHDQLLDGWFGDPRGLHVDAWCFLDSVAGYHVQLARAPTDNGLRLYFINIGGHRPGVFGEHHTWGFFGAPNKTQAKQRPKDTLLPKHVETHKDDLHEVDDCLQIVRVGAWHEQLTPDAGATDPAITNGYFPLPKAVIDEWIARRTTACTITTGQ